MTGWWISCFARALVVVSNVLALLQVRNAIQRMKDKKKALSFTVSCKEALVPPSFILHYQRRALDVCVDSFEEMILERSLIFLVLRREPGRGCLPSVQSCWAMQAPRQSALPRQQPAAPGWGESQGPRGTVQMK